MRLGLSLLCLVVLALVTQQARAESIRWLGEEGDRWEYRVTSVEVVPGWQPLEEMWHLGEVRGAVVEPLVSMTVEARTWRDGVVGVASERHVYVPEPPLLLGLVVGCVALAFSRASRASRPSASQTCRSRQS